MNEVTQIIITVITVLGSASIWKFLEARLKAKYESKKIRLQNSNSYMAFSAGPWILRH